MSNGNIFLLVKCTIAILLIHDVVTDDENHEDLFYKVFGSYVNNRADELIPWDYPDEAMLLAILEGLPNCRDPNITNNIIVPALVMKVIAIQVLYVDCHNENQYFYVRKDPRPNAQNVFILRESADEHPNYICMSVDMVIEEPFYSAPSSPQSSSRSELDQQYAALWSYNHSSPGNRSSPELNERFEGLWIDNRSSRSFPSFPSISSIASIPFIPSPSSSPRRGRPGGNYVLNMGNPPSLDGIALLDDDSTLPTGELAELQTKLYQRYAVEEWCWQLRADLPYENYFYDLCLYLWQRQEEVGENATCGMSTYMTNGGVFVAHLKQITKACYLLDTIFCACNDENKKKDFYIASAADKDYFILKEREVQGKSVHLTIENIVANVSDQYKVVFSTTGSMVIRRRGQIIITSSFAEDWSD